jgi:TM2 domain-containing membrane protein YozV
MKNNHILSFIAAALLAIAGILSFINGSVFRGIIGLIGTISFILSGIHYRKARRNKNISD